MSIKPQVLDSCIQRAEGLNHSLVLLGILIAFGRRVARGREAHRRAGSGIELLPRNPLPSELTIPVTQEENSI